MKKIFTLFAIVLMAMGVLAQTTEKALYENGGSYGNGATISSANCKVVLGNDRTTKNYDLKLSSCKTYCAELFGQQVMVENSETGEMEEKTRVVYVVGNQNPKDGELDGDKSAGSGYKPENGNLPQSGTYYMITPVKDGHICVFIVLNASKNLYVVKASDGTNLPVDALTLKADGEEPTAVTLNDDFTVDEKMTGTLEFDVVANETYYVFCTGSKLSFGGYNFTFEEGDEPLGDTIWESDGSAGAVSWNSIYRFALQGHDGANECIAEIPQAMWDKMMTETFYMDIQAENPQVRVTNGWWEVQWKDDIMPGNSLLTNNGDGTWTVKINLADNPDFVATLLEKHLLFTGDRYTPIKIYFKGETPEPPQPEVGDMYELVHNGDAEGNDGVSLVCKNGDNPDNLFFNVIEGAGVGGSKCVAVTSAVGVANDWDSQFFIYTPDYVFKYGDHYKVSFMAKASVPVELPGPQAHTTPGNYIGWYIDGSSAVNLTTEWQEVSFEGTVNDSMEQYGGVMNGMSTLAYTLNTNKTESITYYFDNVSWKVLVTEGIEEVVNAKPMMNNLLYNLSGQRVDDSYKGVVIKNGRKFINK